MRERRAAASALLAKYAEVGVPRLPLQPVNKLGPDLAAVMGRLNLPGLESLCLPHDSVVLDCKPGGQARGNLHTGVWAGKEVRLRRQSRVNQVRRTCTGVSGMMSHY